MSNKSIFIASPITGFDSQNEYQKYRTELLNIIVTIEKFNNVKNVFSAITNIESELNYEDPAISAKKDFENLHNSTHFILFYPKKIVTSALMELGYAIGQNKQILIVTTDNDILPFMAKKLDEIYTCVTISYTTKFDEILIENIKYFIENNEII